MKDCVYNRILLLLDVAHFRSLQWFVTQLRKLAHFLMIYLFNISTNQCDLNSYVTLPDGNSCISLFGAIGIKTKSSINSNPNQSKCPPGSSASNCTSDLGSKKMRMTNGVLVSSCCLGLPTLWIGHVSGWASGWDHKRHPLERWKCPNKYQQNNERCLGTQGGWKLLQITAFHLKPPKFLEFQAGKSGELGSAQPAMRRLEVPHWKKCPAKENMDGCAPQNLKSKRQKLGLKGDLDMAFCCSVSTCVPCDVRPVCLRGTQWFHDHEGPAPCGVSIPLGLMSLLINLR